jgi:hypothetical protein
LDAGGLILVLGPPAGLLLVLGLLWYLRRR